ncbi:MAG: arsenical pump-driving ATPase [Acidimicrobiia bacterium]
MIDGPASQWTRWRTRFLLFTGKGGVGKTTIATTVAIALAGSGTRVLVVSTDPASNLEDVFGTAVHDRPTPVAGVVGLFAMNIDPDAAAEAYRQKVLAPLRGVVPEAELRGVEEQISGQCTVEVAAFDEFSALLADPKATVEFDHVVFDTAPTGHTLRLLSLPAAWSEYIETTPQGASCLGPLAALEAKRALYEASVQALGDATRTTIVLVSRPDAAALREAARTSVELADLGIVSQRHVVNGLLADPLSGDAVAEEFAHRQRVALDAMPEPLARLPMTTVPLIARDLTGIDALRALSQGSTDPDENIEWFAEQPHIADFSALVADLVRAGPGVIMVMGKGGVGKTTIAVGVARQLARHGLPTHLSTTDPAGRPADLVAEPIPGLTISRIDPAAEVQHYVDEKLQSATGLDPEQRALLEEDLRSPCTEELAVFQAFTNLLRRGRDQYVVVDTAPTGHTLLLLDRTGAYHRDVMRTSDTVSGRVTTPLMRLRDSTFTRVLLVTLAETTPVHETTELQADLRRAGVEPFGWVVNASLAASGTRDPVLRRRATMEHPHLRRVADELATRCWIVPWDAQTLA